MLTLIESNTPTGRGLIQLGTELYTTPSCHPSSTMTVVWGSTEDSAETPIGYRCVKCHTQYPLMKRVGMREVAVTLDAKFDIGRGFGQAALDSWVFAWTGVRVQVAVDYS